MKTTLVAVTQPRITKDGVPLTPEEFIAYAARVSNPSNQLNNDTAARLLAYCIRNKHWSIFETVSFTVEIVTSRAIAAQILRHRSFTFQEFSQRYAVASAFESVELRTQDTKNRQGSGEAFDPDCGPYGQASTIVRDAVATAAEGYEVLIQNGVSKETARMILPLCTQTTLYMTGSVRSWIHYLEQRCSPHAQKEHRLIAEEIRDTIFNNLFPSIAEALKL